MSQRIAKKRIRRLFDPEEQRFAEKKDVSGILANRYGEKPRERRMSYDTSIPSDFKKKYCRHYLSFLKPGFNCKVRINSKNSAINYYFEVCRKVNRYG